MTEPLVIGSLVRFYREGWYTGTLESIENYVCLIRPIAAKGAAKKRVVRVHQEDVENLDSK